MSIIDSPARFRVKDIYPGLEPEWLLKYVLSKFSRSRIANEFNIEVPTYPPIFFGGQCSNWNNVGNEWERIGWVIPVVDPELTPPIPRPPELSDWSWDPYVQSQMHCGLTWSGKVIHKDDRGNPDAQPINREHFNCWIHGDDLLFFLCDGLEQYDAEGNLLNPWQRSRLAEWLMVVNPNANRDPDTRFPPSWNGQRSMKWATDMDFSSKSNVWA